MTSCGLRRTASAVAAGVAISLCFVAAQQRADRVQSSSAAAAETAASSGAIAGAAEPVAVPEPLVTPTTTTPPTTAAPTPPTTQAPPPSIARAAQPAATAVPTPRPTIQQLADQAIASIHYPWRQLGYELVVQPGRPGLMGLTSNTPKRITLYVRPTQSVHEVAFVLAHEIGHAVDFTYGTTHGHAGWLQARGIDVASPWFGCNDCDDLATPAGDFAESFAAWQVGPGKLFSSRLGPPPTAQQQSVLAQLSGPAAG